MDEGSLKKLAKADEYSKAADDLVLKVNAANMQSMSQAGDSVQHPSYDKASLKDLVKAAELYDKSHEIKYTQYKNRLQKFWKTNPGSDTILINEKLLDEQATDDYFQALNHRVQAKNLHPGDEYLNEANVAAELEISSINRLVLALEGCYHITENPKEVIESPSVPDIKQADAPEIQAVPEESDSIVINREIIDLYNRYMNEGQLADTSLSTGKFAGLTTFDADQVLAYWHEYRYGNANLDATVSLAHPDAVKNDSLPVKDEFVAIAVDSSSAGNLKGTVIYKVQIAARRSELTQRALSKMYTGNKSVEMINDNGWYKYSVGDFNTYQEADQFRKSTGISQAFVVAYKKKPAEEPVANVVLADTTRYHEIMKPSEMPAGLIFRVQVAAARNPFSLNQLSKIYSGKYPVEMVHEDGWLKYQLLGVRTYAEASRILKESAAAGAFIVAYSDGKKTDLAASIKESRHQKNTPGGAEFHVQLLASKILLKPEELSKIFGSADQIVLLIEDGLYKYHLKAGNSASLAASLKQSCGVKDAFIVSYKNALRTDLNEALHEKK
jgi:hypothetical protein